MQDDTNSGDQNWPTVLWREWRHCQDEGYKRRLGRLVADVSVSWETKWTSRPLAMEVEAALQQACQAESLVNSSWVKALQLLAKGQQQPDPPERLIIDLQSSDWVTRFVARHTLVAVGGEAVPQLSALISEPTPWLRQTAAWILRSIEVETTIRLFPRLAHRLVCPRCLVSCQAHWTPLSGMLPIVYYGCSACGQSREFWDGLILAVLDAEMVTETEFDGEAMYVNWLARREMFDFDWVEIIQATDEDVERFAVQVGNDTDEERQALYEQMQCLIWSECRLSENTLRVLQHTFGQVERREELTK